MRKGNESSIFVYETKSRNRKETRMNIVSNPYPVDIRLNGCLRLDRYRQVPNCYTVIFFTARIYIYIIEYDK